MDRLLETLMEVAQKCDDEDFMEIMTRHVNLLSEVREFQRQEAILVDKLHFEIDQARKKIRDPYKVHNEIVNGLG